MTTESETKTKSVTVKDGIGISPEAKRKPRLIVKKTQFEIKVRLHKQDKRHVQTLYDFITDLGQDLELKKTEFASTGWIILPEHFLKVFKKSQEFDIQMETNERLKWIKGC